MLCCSAMSACVSTHVCTFLVDVVYCMEFILNLRARYKYKVNISHYKFTSQCTRMRWQGIALTELQI